MFEDDDLDLSPEVLCSLGRRRARAALLASEVEPAEDRIELAAATF